MHFIILSELYFIALLVCLTFRNIDNYIDLKFDDELDNKFVLKRIYIERDNKQIYGSLCIPKYSSSNLKLVILAHGFGVNHRSMIKYSRMLVKKGIASFTFDFLGGSSSTYSDGEMESMSVITEARDLKAVMDKIKEFNFIDKNEIYLLGHSQGGVVCALYANKHESDIKGLFLINPAFILADMTKDASLPKKGEFVIKYDEVKGRRYFLDGRKINLFDSFTNYKKNVLIFHGENDKVVPLSYSKKARRAYDNAKLFIMKEEGHMLSDEAISKIIDIIYEYIKKWWLYSSFLFGILNFLIFASFSFSKSVSKKFECLRIS